MNMNMNEVLVNGERAMWIKGFEGVYRVTESGIVVRYYKCSDKIKAMKPGISRYNYTQYQLGRKLTVTAHRLVALHFLENPNGYTQVDHIDENKANNHYTNLRWCTPQENVAAYVRNNANDYRTKINNARDAKLNALQKQLQIKDQQIRELEKRLLAKEAQLRKAEKALHATIDAELDKTPEKYSGYANIKNVTFTSIEEMVEVVGKPITINGITFRSCAMAADYITKEELKFGYTRNRGTISKELRRYLQGCKSSWSMYGRYLVK